MLRWICSLRNFHTLAPLPPRPPRTNSGRVERRTTAQRLAALVFGSALILAPGLAFATPLTLTFDTGLEDPTIMPDESGEIHGPYDWLESGARIAPFWAIDVGTVGGAYQQGHLHPIPARPGRDFGIKEVTHAWTDDLQGFVISVENGSTFDLISIDYRITSLENLADSRAQRLPWSFAATDPNILATTHFDPALTDFESQWDAFSVPMDSDWRTLNFSGLNNLTSVMITQTAHLAWLDNIVLDVHTQVPEPSTALLLGLGLAVMARRKSGSR